MSDSMVLQLDDPDARCSICGFHNTLSGQWTVEEGRLVFRADADPLQSRGPDLNGCSECGSTLAGIASLYGEQTLSAVQVAALQATAEVEVDRWEAEER